MTLVAGVHLQAVGLEDDLKETPEICWPGEEAFTNQGQHLKQDIINDT